MLNVDVQLDIASWKKRLAEIDERHVRFATAAALTWVAQDAWSEVERQLPQVFDRPTPQTMKAIRYIKATKQSLVSEVKVTDYTDKSKPPISWLGHEIYGGARPYKRMEFLLMRAGILPQGHFVVPGKGARLDAYGNMSRGQVQQILAATQSAWDTLQRATPRSKRRNRVVKQIFALREQRGKLRPGIYQRVGQGVIALLVFVESPRYTIRLGFDAIVERVVRERFERQFQRAAALAESTAFESINAFPSG
jgi:hypothetical protein